MPPTQRPLPDGEGDIWDRHQTLLRRLYESERKTLKEVKLVMENEHGFPRLPLSTYETNLRDKLQLRKKLKKTDWPLIYREHLRQGGKDSVIYLHGTPIPWRRAWKEIRRSGAHLETRDLSSPVVLPAGVTVRTLPTTPPPTGYPNTPATTPGCEGNALAALAVATAGSRMLLLPTRCEEPVLFDNTSNYASTGPSVEFSHAGALNQDCTEFVLKQCLETIPWRKFLAMMISGSPSRGSHTDYDYSLFSSSIGISFDQTFFSPRAQGDELALNFDTYHFLAKAMFFFSNDHFLNDNTRDILEIVFTQIPKSVLLGLLESGIPTVRAAWENLVHLTGHLHRKDDFLLLLRVGLRYPHWIDRAGQKYLLCAASMGSLTSVNLLLAAGVRPGSVDFDHPVLDAIYFGHMNIAETLIKHCDVNRESHPQMSVFQKFLEDVLEVLDPDSELSYRLLYQNYQAGLDLMIEAGAEVDGHFRMTGLNTKGFFQYLNLHGPLCVTLLDHVYYSNIGLFRKMERYSARSRSEITRAGVCTAAKESTESLRQYLRSRPPWKLETLQKFLECILFEQFIRCSHFEFDIIQNLINYGVDVQLRSLPPKLKLWSAYEVRSVYADASYLFGQFIAKVRKNGSLQRSRAILDHLLQAGAEVDEFALGEAVEREGFYLLRVLTDIFGADIRENGARALAKAACANNYEAVDWLMQRGANVNGVIKSRDFSSGQYSVIAAVVDEHFSEPASPEMLEYLISRGAKLRLHPSETNAFNFLRYALKGRTKTTQLKERFQVFLDTGVNLGDSSGSRPTLLESCLGPLSDGVLHFGQRYPPGYLYRFFYFGQQYPPGYSDRLATFKLLFGRGAPVRPGSALALLIKFDGGDGLIQEVIDAGADVNGTFEFENSHSTDPWSITPLSKAVTPLQAAFERGNLKLAINLLHRGANINAPAIGYCGKTALQAACEWEPLSTEEEQRRTELIRHLVDRGADVNAGPAPNYGGTALQIAAIRGDLETAFFLLEHKANINAPAACQGYCALDGAALRGRLDMVKFLLNANALSQRRGSTGYDGAIWCAETKGHLAVADLIRKHAADNPGWGLQDVDEGQYLYPNEEGHAVQFGFESSEDDASSEDAIS